MEPLAAPTNLPFVEFSFAPNLRLIPLVRHVVSGFYRELFGDIDQVSEFALATHELLENAVKYSADGLTRVRIELRGAVSDHRVRITTWNRPRADDLTAFVGLMTEMLREPDHASFYRKLMMRSLDRAEGSGLGLGRILAETSLGLTHQIEDGVLLVIAESPTPAAA